MSVEEYAKLRLTPRPALMKVLHLAGGTSETFTLDEIFYHVKNYVKERRLYNKHNPWIVRCGKDLLGAALGVETFTVHEALNLYRKNCMEPASGICVWAIRPNRWQPQATTASGTASYTEAVLVESDVEYLADYSDSDSGTDVELDDADKWECKHCQKKNPPFHRDCGRCWSLRPERFPSSMKDVQGAACGHQQGTSTQILHSDKSVNVQPHSQQMSNGAISSSLEQTCDRLDLNNSSAIGDGKICRKRKCSSSLCSSDFQEGKAIKGIERIQQAHAAKFCKLRSANVLLYKEEACVVCLTERKTATIVHGKTGHQSCCMDCATQLKRKRMPCPICRRPIQKVIQHFYV